MSASLEGSKKKKCFFFFCFFVCRPGLLWLCFLSKPKKKKNTNFFFFFGCGSWFFFFFLFFSLFLLSLLKFFSLLFFFFFFFFFSFFFFSFFFFFFFFFFLKFSFFPTPFFFFFFFFFFFLFFSFFFFGRLPEQVEGRYMTERASQWRDRMLHPWRAGLSPPPNSVPPLPASHGCVALLSCGGLGLQNSPPLIGRWRRIMDPFGSGDSEARVQHRRNDETRLARDSLQSDGRSGSDMSGCPKRRPPPRSLSRDACRHWPAQVALACPNRAGPGRAIDRIQGRNSTPHRTS